MIKRPPPRVMVVVLTAYICLHYTQSNSMAKVLHNGKLTCMANIFEMGPAPLGENMRPPHGCLHWMLSKQDKNDLEAEDKYFQFHPVRIAFPFHPTLFFLE